MSNEASHDGSELDECIATARGQLVDSARDALEPAVHVALQDARCAFDSRLLADPRRGPAADSPSGGRSDSMTLAIAHDRDGETIVDLVEEARAPFNPDDVCRRFAETLERYRVVEVTGDRVARGEIPRARDHVRAGRQAEGRPVLEPRF